MEGLSNYEQIKVSNMTRRPSGVGIAGLVLGVTGTVAALGAGLWAGAKAKAAKDVAIAKNDGLRDLVQSLANTVNAERNERIEGDRTLSISINDTLSGQQSGQLTASQIAQQEQAQELTLGLMTGKYSENPQKVMLYSAPQPCGCPNTCGCAA